MYHLETNIRVKVSRIDVSQLRYRLFNKLNRLIYYNGALTASELRCDTNYMYCRHSLAHARIARAHAYVKLRVHTRESCSSR